MTAARYREQAAREQAEQRAAALEAELAQYRAMLAGGTQPSSEPPQPPRAPMPAPQPTAAPQDVDARARQLLEAQAFNDACNRAVEVGRKDIPTFDQSVSTLASMGALFEPSGEPTTLAQVIMDTDIPHRILDALGQDPETAERILEMTPRQQAREIGRLEARLSASSPPAAASPPSAPAAPSNAPPPVRPVGNRGVSMSNAPSANDSIDDWMRKRNRQLYGART